MSKSWIIAKRELFERLGSRSFLMMAFFGPLIVLSLTYLVLTLGGNDQQKWKILIVDPAGIMEQKIMAGTDASISYDFANNYVEVAHFANDKRFENYDALLEVNEKIVTNKSGFLFYREKPSLPMTINIRYQLERRLEELVAEEFTDLSIQDFRKIKQPIQLGFRNVYDPEETSVDFAGWVGLFFGAIILLFIFLFGMTILRAVTREKSNRIVEILVATVTPRALMLGKIIGIGLAALLQFTIWMIIVGIGLYFMRDQLFVDQFLGENVVEGITANDYNQLVELIFERVQFAQIIPYFLVFFFTAYLFYAAFFAALGATSGSESDGQQFLLPLIMVLFFALYSGYDVMMRPDSSSASFYAYFPFTAPVVVMVKLALGYPEGTAYQLFVSFCILLLSAVLMLQLAGRLYKNGLLQFGHSLRLKQLLGWLKQK